MGVKGKLMVGAVCIIMITSLQAGTWSYSKAKIDTKGNLSITKSPYALIATEFIEKSDSSEEWKSRYYLKVTNHMSVPIQIIVDFEKGLGAGQDLDEDKGIELEDQNSWVTITPDSFVELPVKISAGNEGKASPLGTIAFITAQWDNGSAIIKDELTGEDK